MSNVTGRAQQRGGVTLAAMTCGAASHLVKALFLDILPDGHLQG